VEAQAHARYSSTEKAEYAMSELDTTATLIENLRSHNSLTAK